MASTSSPDRDLESLQRNYHRMADAVCDDGWVDVEDLDVVLAQIERRSEPMGIFELLF